MTDNQQPSSEAFRPCKKCGGVKPLSEFPSYTLKGKRLWRHECTRCRSTYSAAWARGEIVPVPQDPDNRTCKKCGETKPLSDFATVYAQNSRGQQYKSHTCLDCFRSKHAAKEKRRRAEKPERYRELKRKWYAANPEKAKAHAQGTHRRLKDQVFEAYGGYKCVCCGEVEPSMLNIDHVENDGNEHRRKLGLSKRRLEEGLPPTNPASATMYHWLRANGFPPGFQVLCYNCNISKFRNGGVCAHELRRRFND
jgi:hypothetical protein